MLRGKAQRDAPAERVPEDIDLAVPELLQQQVDVVGHRFAAQRPVPPGSSGRAPAGRPR